MHIKTDFTSKLIVKFDFVNTQKIKQFINAVKMIKYAITINNKVRETRFGTKKRMNITIIHSEYVINSFI